MAKLEIDRTMSIEKLTSSIRSLASLRSENKSGTSVVGRSSPGASDSKDLNQLRVGDKDTLRERLIHLAKSVDLGDEESVRLIRPQIIRNILLSEFGAGVRERRDWQHILESIDMAIERNPESKEDFLKLLLELKR